MNDLCFSLSNDFDEEKLPDLYSDVYMQDIHCISSLLKAYFRELPNPLLTYQLYDKFAVSVINPYSGSILQCTVFRGSLQDAVQNQEDRLFKIYDVIQQLPPPHYRFLLLAHCLNCHA